MLQVDSEKACDSVSHKIVFSILEHTNVGSVFSGGLHMIYRNIYTRLVEKHVQANVFFFLPSYTEVPFRLRFLASS